MTLVTTPSGSAVPAPSSGSVHGLDGVNFFIAGMAAGFGPYIAVYLATQKWTQQDIGFALTAGGLAGLLSQVPGGELVDILRSKRTLIALGAIIMAASAIIIDVRPAQPFVFTGLVLQGITGGFVGPAIVAISLGLVGHAVLPERLGRNQRFASIGGLASAGMMGLIANFLSYRAIFATVAVLALPVFVMLARIRPGEIHFGRACGAPDQHAIEQPARVRRKTLWQSPVLLTIVAGFFLFQLANASILPLVGESLVYRGQSHSSLIVSALIIVPQIIVAAAAPWVGQKAKSWGRRPLLLVGFGVLPVRALLFAFITDPSLFVVVQLLDGVSGAVLGVLTALVIADAANGTGRFNLAQGIVGTASGIGASLSTTLFGLLATNYGHTVAFLTIALAALFATLILWLFLPETRPPARK